MRASSARSSSSVSFAFGMIHCSCNFQNSKMTSTQLLLLR